MPVIIMTMTISSIRKEEGMGYISCTVFPSLGPHSHRGGDPDCDPGHSCNQHVSSPPRTRPSAEPQLRPLSRAFGERGSHLHSLPPHGPRRPPAHAKLRLPGTAKAQTRPHRPPTHGRSPRFCPRSTAYGRLRSGGSTGLGASACPSRRLHSPRQSHCQPGCNIFPTQQWRATHFRRNPRPGYLSRTAFRRTGRASLPG